MMKNLIVISFFFFLVAGSAYGQSWPRFFWKQMAQSDSTYSFAITDGDKNGRWLDSLRWLPVGPYLRINGDTVATRDFVTDQLSTYYVDGNFGNDTNTGLSEKSAFKTLARASTAVNASSAPHTIKLARNSHFRESLDLTNTFDSITITAYGAGRLPIIDGSSIQSSWSATGGYSNVYDATLTKENTNEDDLPVYENGVVMIKATSIANCEATAGSYYYTENTSTEAIFYIHPSDGGNPNSNGSTYEVTLRTCIEAGDNVYISNAHVQRSSDRAGAMISYYNSGRNDIITKDGTTHNELNSGGTFENIIALDFQEQSAGGTVFVSYDDSPPRLTASYINCYAVNSNENVIVDGTTGFYAHGSGSNEWQKITLNDCLAYRVSAAANPVTDSLIITNSSFQKIETFSFSNSDTDGTSHYHKVEGNQIWVDGSEVSTPPAKGQLYNNAFYLEDAGATHLWLWQNVDTFNFKNNVFYTENRAIMRNTGGGGGLMQNYNNVFFGKPQNFYHVEADSLEYEGDYNIYFAQNYSGGNAVNMRLNGTLNTVHTTLASWIAATGHDQNSVWLTPMQAANFWAGNPLHGDFRINPDCEVTYVDPVDATYNNGDDVIRTLKGEFPDGTKITEAGIRPGFPTAWKFVPMTLEDCYKILAK